MALEPSLILPKGAIRPSKPPILPPKRAPWPPPLPLVLSESDVDKPSVDESDVDKLDIDESDVGESDIDESDVDELDADDEIPPLKPHIGQEPRHDIGTRVQALSLFEYRVPIL